MQAKKVKTAEDLRTKRRKGETPTMPPNEAAMEFLRTSDGLRPPRKPQFVRDFANENPYVPEDAVATKQLSDSTPVLDNDGPMDEVGGLQLPELFQEPYIERSATPSDSPPSPPSPRIRQLDVDTLVPDPDDEPLSLESPHIRDDMDLDDDIPVWDPEEEAESQSRRATPAGSPFTRNDMDLIMELDEDIPVWDPEDDDGGPLTRQASQNSSSEGVRAYQEHLNGFLRKYDSQQTQRRRTPESISGSPAQPFLKSFPFKCTAEEAVRDARNIKYKMCHHLEKLGEQLHPSATGRGAWRDQDGTKWPVGMEPPEAQKEEGSDQELLKALFMSVP